MVTLPGSLLEKFDREVDRLDTRRSALIRELMERWLSEQRVREFEELMAEGYRERYAEHEEWARAIAPLQDEVAATSWEWADD